VDPAVGEDQERQLAGVVETLRGEEVGVELDVVTGVDTGGVLFLPPRRSVDAALVDHGDVAHALVPEDIVDALCELVELVAGSCRSLLDGGNGIGFRWVVRCRSG
jgi:hypothetical protein